MLWLIEWLSEDSAFIASVRGGPEHRPWTLATALAAGAHNGIAAGNWQRGGGRGKRPTPVEPPKAETAGRRRGGATADRLARMGALAASSPDSSASPQD